MARRLVSIILFLILVSLPFSSAQAHVLSTENTVGAILHINPDDSPSYNIPTNFELWFTDTSSQFSLYDCDCMVAFKVNGKTVGTQALSANDRLDSSNTYSFPSPGLYALEVVGKPKRPDSFHPFVLDYAVRVNSGNIQVQSMPALLWVGIAGTIGLIVLAAYAMEYNYNNARSKLDNRDS